MGDFGSTHLIRNIVMVDTHINVIRLQPRTQASTHLSKPLTELDAECDDNSQRHPNLPTIAWEGTLDPGYHSFSKWAMGSSDVSSDVTFDRATRTTGDQADK